MTYATRRSGFTIVELLIVVVVIGILAAIAIVTYNGVLNRAIVATLESDLANSKKQLSIDHVNVNTFPATLALANGNKGLAASAGVGYQYTANTSATPQTFCLTASLKKVSYYITQDTTPTAGACSGHVFGGVSNTFTDLAFTQQSGAGTRTWYDMASSADGVKLAAVARSSYVYTSADSGVTWVERTSAGSREWDRIVSSADGTKLAASTSGVYSRIATSNDSGVTWVQQPGSPNTYWTGVAMSSDGTILYAAASGSPADGMIYKSTDSGITWVSTGMGGSLNTWSNITTSDDGAKVVAVRGSGYPYISLDYGVTWTSPAAAGYRSWYVAGISGDGTKMYIGEYGGTIYRSTNNGGAWTALNNAGNANWRKIVSSTDGTKLVLGVNGNILRTSIDSGANWTQHPSISSGSWYAVSASSDGSKIRAARYNNSLFTGIWN